MAHSSSLTFRLELQCIVRYDPVEYFPVLQEIGLPPTVTAPDRRLANIVRKHIAHELMVQGDMTSESSERHKIWYVDGDDTIQLSSFPKSDSDECSYCDVKITSPNYLLSTATLSIAKDAIETLAGSFDVLTDPAFCGLQVHVGCHRKAFKLQQ